MSEAHHSCLIEKKLFSGKRMLCCCAMRESSETRQGVPEKPRNVYEPFYAILHGITAFSSQEYRHTADGNRCASRTLKRIGNSNFRLSNTVYSFTLR